jgi:hypothetical protein
MAMMTPEERQKLMDEIHNRALEGREDSYENNEEDNLENEEEGQPRDEKGRFTSKKKEEDNLSNNEEEQGEENIEEDDVEEEEEASIDEFLNYDDLKQKKVKVKINGEELLINADELLSNYQKEKSADKKFQEAAKLQKDLADERLALIQFQQKLIEQQQEITKNATKQPVQSLPEKDDEKELIESLMLGDQEKSVEKLKEVVSKLSAAEIERRLNDRLASQTTELEQKAYEKAYEAMQLKQWEDSLKVFATKRDDIVQDEILTQVFDSKLQAIAKEVGLSPLAIQKAEEEFDKWASSKGIKVKTMQVQEEKHDVLAERKAKVEQVKKLSVGQAASAKSQAKKEEPEKQGSDLIAEMKRQRQWWLDQ